MVSTCLKDADHIRGMALDDQDWSYCRVYIYRPDLVDRLVERQQNVFIALSVNVETSRSNEQAHLERATEKVAGIGPNQRN